MGMYTEVVLDSWTINYSEIRKTALELELELVMELDGAQWVAYFPRVYKTIGSILIPSTM